MNYRKKLEEYERQQAIEAEAKKLAEARQVAVEPAHVATGDLDAAEVVARELWHQDSPDVIYTKIKYLFKLTEAQATAIIESIRKGGTPEWPDAFCFWAGTGNKKTLQVDELKFFNAFLYRKGFRRHMPGQVSEGFILVQVVDNIIYNRNMGQVKSITFDYIKTLPVQMTLPGSENSDPVWRSDVQRAVMKMERGLFAMGKAEFLPDLATNVLKDTYHSSFFVYRNGWIEVSKSGISELRPHSSLPGLVWSDQIIDRDFHPPNGMPSQAESFIHLISGQDDKRSHALRTAIGYLLHRFKSPSLNKAVILMDEQVSQLPNGGTGKSLIGQMINHVRPTLLIDGRAFRPDKSFLFQRYRDFHSVINFDDVHQWFNLDFVYVTLTQGLTVERKGKDEVMTAFADTPKILISTNFVILGEGQSNLRRRADYEISPHFHSNWQPKDEFGKQFFVDWTEADWGAFDSFMHRCCREFLCDGLVVPDTLNRTLRTLIQVTAPEFPDFMKEYLEGIVPDAGTWVRKVPKQAIYKEWLAYAGWNEKDLSEKKWKKWLEAWANHNQATISEGRLSATSNESMGARIWLIKMNGPNTSTIHSTIGETKVERVTDSDSDDSLPF